MADSEEQNRQEEQMAGGPVSAGASNESTPYKQNKQPIDDARKQTNPDYEARVNKTAPVGENTGASGSLGTVGGGNVPAGSESGSSTEEVNASDSTVERDSVRDTQAGASPAATNTVDKQAQGNLGGRNPGQPQTPTGDQDATQGRPGEEITDPMSSRAPDKINKKVDQ